MPKPSPWKSPDEMERYAERTGYERYPHQYKAQPEDQLAARLRDLFDEYQVPSYISSNIRAAVENTVINARSRAPSELFEAIRLYGYNLDDLAGWSRANLGIDHETFMHKVREIERDFKQAYLNAYHQKE